MLDGGRPVARVVRPGASTFERVELGATLETQDTGPKLVRWPGAAILLKGLLAPAAAHAVRPSPVLAAPRKPVAIPEQRPFYKSGWFWGTVGGVAAVGITVFVLSKTTSDSGNTVHLGGHVAP